jgi:predicted metallo-beta-lactamase superfamily hydrolase
MQKLKVTPLAAESLGVRSMCTYVETPSLRILLDAGVSLCPSRFRLPPHPREFQAIIEAREKIVEYADRADVVTISHYHFDHHTPSFEDWLCNWTDTETARQVYEGKLVLAKDYGQNVNASQRRRGWVFEKTGGKHAKRIEPADGREFLFGETRVKFSSPVFHGLPNTPLGWVIMTTIEYEDEKMLFASDVQGPLDSSTVQTILDEKPQLAIIGGPPLYLADFRVDRRQLAQGLKNLETLSKKIALIVAEHHLLRDTEWRGWAKQALESALKSGNRIATAAEFLGRKDLLLEAGRKQLYVDEPPSREFEKWSKLPERRLRMTKPPL